MNNLTKIRIKDVAKRANVSVGTVDRVLHNRGEVSAHTRDLVITIIEEMGYKPNVIASALAQKKRTRFALLVPMVDGINPFYLEYEAGIEKAKAELIDFGTLVDVHAYDPILNTFSACLERCLETAPDAIIASPMVLSEADKNRLEAFGWNKVTLFGPNAGHNEALQMSQDAFRSGYVGARLLSYGLPKETTVLVINIGRNALNDQLYQERFAGFRQYLNDRNITEMSIRKIEIEGIQEGDIKKSLTNAFLDYSFVRGLFVSGSHTGKVARFIEEKKLGNIRVVGYDLTDENVQYLRKGHIDFLLSQNPRVQAYRAIMSTFEHHMLDKAFPAKRIPVDIITKDNVDDFIP
ncbi:MAG: substrate-binding domain-containing protein [Cytophagaceae bacterium]|nr:substrate-binding domain-containing protein [Cytophagaceae bacterium]